MADFKQLEFYLLRYVPIAVRDEFVNIGVILVEPDHAGFGEVRFAPDWRMAERIDPQADIEVLQAMERYARKQFQDPETRALFLRKMEDSFSNLVQLSPMRACLAEDPAREIEALASFYFKSIHPPSQRIPSGRSRIWQEMHTAFEQQGVLRSLRADIAMAQYTQPGDPLKLDFAYTFAEKLKVFQAVSLKGTLNPARYFGSRAAGIVHDLAKHARTTPFLTAVVEDDWERNNPDVEYVLETLINSQVEVSALADMPKIAAQARLDLKL